jgi:hypothetical protein
MRALRKWMQRYHGTMAVYHVHALRRHCSHLPAWFIQDTLGMEAVK